MEKRLYEQGSDVAVARRFRRWRARRPGSRVTTTRTTALRASDCQKLLPFKSRGPTPRSPAPPERRLSKILARGPQIVLHFFDTHATGTRVGAALVHRDGAVVLARAQPGASLNRGNKEVRGIQLFWHRSSPTRRLNSAQGMAGHCKHSGGAAEGVPPPHEADSLRTELPWQMLWNSHPKYTRQSSRGPV